MGRVAVRSRLRAARPYLNPTVLAATPPPPPTPRPNLKPAHLVRTSSRAHSTGVPTLLSLASQPRWSATPRTLTLCSSSSSRATGRPSGRCLRSGSSRACTRGGSDRSTVQLATTPDRQASSLIAKLDLGIGEGGAWRLLTYCIVYCVLSPDALTPRYSCTDSVQYMYMYVSYVLYCKP